MADDDDLLMARLRVIAGTVDEPPPLLDEGARAALSTRRLDDELAELMVDSELAESALVRDGEEGIRLLSFETATVSVELQLEELDGRLVLRGLVSGASGEAIVETASGRHTAPIDAQGWFSVGDLPRGAIRVRVRADDGTAVTTSWVTA